VLRGVPCERCKGNRFIQCTVNRCKKDSLGASVVATLEAEVDRFIGPAKRVDRFISPSRYLLGKFAEFGWDTAKFVHIPNFAPSPTAAVRRAPAPGRFAYIGRVETPKGIGALIEAIGATEGATLQVAGEGPLEGRYRALAARVAPGRVTFRGLLDQVSLDEIRDSSLALVVPSEWNENGPLTVIEALNRGCPVVASERGGLPEMVQHDVNGLLFPSGDVERLAESLRRMMSEPGLAARLGEQAARESSERSVDVYLSRLLEVYRSVIEERAAKGGSH
jgi:glycosyltransferase involved in cell wall biosynthesis